MELLQHQADFIESDFVHTGIVGGFRSGKSHAGVIKTITKKLLYPGIDVAYYLPTYGLIRDIAYPKFQDLLQEFGVPFTLNKSDHEFSTPFGRIILRSMDNPDSIIGYEVGYSIIDEADILPTKHMKDVFVKVVARLSVPLPDEKPNSLDFVSTPEGFKFLHHFFVKEGNAGMKKLIKARTKNNPFISKSYIATLMLSYTPQQLLAYLNGEFVNLTSGSVYHRFDRKRNDSKREVLPNDVLHIGMDFNVTKMNAVVFVKDGIIRTAVDEFVNAYDTAELAGLIASRYQGRNIVIYPDASGGARNSSGRSDIAILKEHKFVVRALKKNPFVKDRVNAMNTSFLNTKEEVTHFVNTDNCPVYTEAIEQIAYDNNGEPDKKSGFDHITEAGGYFNYYDSKPTSSWGSSSLA